MNVGIEAARARIAEGWKATVSQLIEHQAVRLPVIPWRVHRRYQELLQENAGDAQDYLDDFYRRCGR